jgi:hypothetical protein
MICLALSYLCVEVARSFGRGKPQEF